MARPLALLAVAAALFPAPAAAAFRIVHFRTPSGNIQCGSVSGGGFPAEFLRVESPSAEVQGHGPGQKQLVAGRQHVGILALEPVGNYAVRIKFDDLHDTGIYSWQYMRQLGENKDQIWRDYLAALEAKGLSHDPRGAKKS